MLLPPSRGESPRPIDFSHRLRDEKSLIDYSTVTLNSNQGNEIRKIDTFFEGGRVRASRALNGAFTG